MHTHSEIEREIRFSVGAAVGLAVCRDRNTATALPVNVVVFTIHSCAHSPMPYNGKVIMDRKRSTNIQIYCTPPPNYCVRLLNVPKHKKQETSSSSNRRSIQCIRNVLRERAPVSNVWWIEWVPLCCDSVEQYTLNGAFGSLLVCACVCLCKTLLSLSVSPTLRRCRTFVCMLYTQCNTMVAALTAVAAAGKFE